jgi:tRNA pseudouridine(55) synthase
MHSSPSTFKKPYALIEKQVGETPLAALERFRSDSDIPKNVPLAYAGRLDPMASGKLLILIGDECKRQRDYHGLDKEYEFSVLIGTASDTGDVLGIISTCSAPQVTENAARIATQKLVGALEMPYPHFSSKTVHGKPLHVWTLEKRLGEIKIPTKHSHIFSLKLTDLCTITKQEAYAYVTRKIETIPEVTDPRKALGADFRRSDVHAAWNKFLKDGAPEYQVATFSCIASSGTYMRSLAEKIAEELGTCGLAYHIHRSKIGKYAKVGSVGLWTKKFK